MALSNAERQRRYRERLKAKALRNDCAAPSLQAAWDAASNEEILKFLEDNELSTPAERAQLVVEAMRLARLQALEDVNSEIEEVIEREVERRMQGGRKRNAKRKP